MGSEGRTDEAKGRAKEAAGALADDDRLRREGRVEQAAGRVKRKAGEVVDEVKEKLTRKDGRDSGKS